MSYTTSQIENLEKALAAGVLEVEYENRRVRYQSAAEMRRTLADMKAEASSANAKPRFADTIYDRD